MYLIQSRIRNTNRLLKDIEDKQNFYLGVKLSNNNIKIIQEKFGICEPDKNKAIFPSPFNGIMSKRNAVGEFIPQKDKPKETAYRPHSWELPKWGGGYSSGSSYVPYKRYPRLFIEPKEFKFIITEDSDRNEIIILSKRFTKDKELENIKGIIFGANLVLEIFNEVNTFVFNKSDDIISTSNIKTVNWEILPKGEKVWESFNAGTTEKLSVSEQFLIEERFDYINSLGPDQIWKGIGGYTDYLVFEFTALKLFIFDSILYGEAMYVFKNDWEHVSRLTKREIIQGRLAEERIVHNKQWKAKLNKYLRPKIEK